VDRGILSKFGFERDLNIAKRVLLLNPKSGVDFQLYMAAIFQNFINRYDVITLPWVVPFGWHLVDIS